MAELGRLNKRLKFYKFGPWSYPVYTCVYCMSWVCKNVTWLHENEVKPFKMQHSVMIFFLFFFRLCFGLCQSQSRNQLKRSVFAHNQVLNFQFMSGESDPPIIFNNHLCFAVNREGGIFSRFLAFLLLRKFKYCYLSLNNLLNFINNYYLIKCFNIFPLVFTFICFIFIRGLFFTSFG